jgi:hypothetical protein
MTACAPPKRAAAAPSPRVKVVAFLCVPIDCQIHCANPVSISIGFQRAVSATIKLRNSSTVNVSATSPSWRSRFATSGRSVILTISRFTFWAMSSGNPAGPASPNQLVLTRSGKPSSLNVVLAGSQTAVP